MDLFALIDWMASGPGFVLLAIVTFLLGAGSILAPLWSPAAKASAESARLSPLWIVPAFAGVVAALVFLPFINNHEARYTVVQIAALVVELGVSVWVCWRHRRWPWLVVPFALSLLVWEVLLVGVLVLAGVVDH